MDSLIQDTLDTFFSQSPHGLIVVSGPTASGKSALAIEIALSLQERGLSPFIVSADSRQIYRGMDIGTGKIRPEEMQSILHYLLDVVDPSEQFSVVDFRLRVEALDPWNAWKNGSDILIPIICGGTGLYIDSLIYERDYMGDIPDPIRRRELEEYAEIHGSMALWEKLEAIDPTYAHILHPNNRSYIIRGIEIFEDTGRSKLEAQHGLILKYPTLFLSPYEDSLEKRAALYEKINLRVADMFSTGLIQEVEYIIYTFGANCPGLTTIGYREVVEYLTGTLTLAESIALVSQHSRNYAKRQITWNKKYELHSHTKR